MILDQVAAAVRRVLGIFSPEVADVLFLPVFVLAVMIGVVLAVHKLLPPLSRLAAVLLTWAITGVSVLVLLLEMVVADAFRRRGSRPPSTVYNLGDAVAAWASALTAGVRRLTASAAGVLARAKVPVLLLLSVGWIWLWNLQHCPDAAAGCARPVSEWFQLVSDEQL